MSFLPEDDRDFFERKGLKFELREERTNGTSVRRAVLLPEFEFAGNLRRDGTTEPPRVTELLVLVPDGYSSTRLDSFYTSPVLKRPDGSFPDRANSIQTLFDRSWQFWSRHLAENEWRAGQDGFETYLQYIRAELRRA